MRWGERAPPFQVLSSPAPPLAVSLVGMLMPPPLLGGAMSWDCQTEDDIDREEGGETWSGRVTGGGGLACCEGR